MNSIIPAKEPRTIHGLAASKLRWLGLTVMVFASTLLMWPSAAPGQVSPPHAMVLGKSIEDWTAAFQSWAITQSPNRDPYLDPDGRWATNSQSAPIFFVAGAGVAGTVTIRRAYTVPENKYLLVPLLIYTDIEGPYGDPNQWRNMVSAVFEPPPILRFKMNGTTVGNLLDHRESTPAFTIELPNLDNALTGEFGMPIMGFLSVVVEGYWLMLEPLPGGTNLLDFGSCYTTPGANCFSRMDTITVRPLPLEQWVAEFMPVVEESLAESKFQKPLLHHLQEAQKQFQSGHRKAGLSQLREFEKKTREHLGTPAPLMADDLIRFTERIIARAGRE